MPTQRVSRGDGPARPLQPWAGSADLASIPLAVASDGGGASVPHAVMSVTKSLVGCVCAVLMDRGGPAGAGHGSVI